MSGTQPNAKRTRPMMMVTLAPDAIDRLRQIAERTGRSRSAVIEALIREAPMPRGRP